MLKVAQKAWALEGDNDHRGLLLWVRRGRGLRLNGVASIDEHDGKRAPAEFVLAGFIL